MHDALHGQNCIHKSLLIGVGCFNVGGGGTGDDDVDDDDVCSVDDDNKLALLEALQGNK